MRRPGVDTSLVVRLGQLPVAFDGSLQPGHIRGSCGAAQHRLVALHGFPEAFERSQGIALPGVAAGQGGLQPDAGLGIGQRLGGGRRRGGGGMMREEEKGGERRREEERGGERTLVASCMCSQTRLRLAWIRCR